jgi:hypothetical protein
MALTDAQRLEQAEAALHQLQTGGMAVRVRDQNGEEIEFQRTSISQLVAYIEQLKKLVNPVSGAGPMRVFF